MAPSHWRISTENCRSVPGLICNHWITSPLTLLLPALKATCPLVIVPPGTRGSPLVRQPPVCASTNASALPMEQAVQRIGYNAPRMEVAAKL